MSKATAGAQLLRAYILDQRKPGSGPPGFMFSATAFARCLGVSRQRLRVWTQGLSRPSGDHITRIAEVTSGRVPAGSWAA